MSHETPNSAPFYVTGGTLPPDASSYVERAADRDLLSALLAGEYCYVLNSRQMGKSSLSVRTIGKLQDAGIKTAFVDLTRIGAQNVSPEQWYAGLLAETGRALGLRTEFLKYWKEQLHLPPVQRYFTAIREVALGRDDRDTWDSGDERDTEKVANPSQIVVFVDEIDAVRSLSFSADEFFAAVRACHNARMEDPVYSRLTFCLVGSATPSDLISDTRMSPFNVGKRIELRDFTRAECAPLNAGLIGPISPISPTTLTTALPEPVEGPPLLDRIYHWTNGHPYLTQSLCAAAVEASVKTVAEIDHLVETLFLEAKARERNPNLADVSNRVLSSYLDATRRDEHRASILDLYGRVLGRPGTIEDDETNPLVALLKLAGITRSEGGKLSVRNRIYERVFDRRWIDVSMPDGELRRQRVAYQRGLFRAAAMATIIFLVMGGLLKRSADETRRANTNAKTAAKESKRAQIAEREARIVAFRAERTLYTSDMSQAQQAWSNNNIARLRELLEETRINPDRGWEWGYWHRLCNPDVPTMEGFGAFYVPTVRRIVTASPDCIVRVYDAPTKRKIFSFKTDQSDLRGGCASLDGKRVATASWDGTVAIWDAATGRKLVALAIHRGQARGVTFSPDGNMVASTGGAHGKFGEAYLWDSRTGRKLHNLSGHTDYVSDVAFSPDGTKVVTCSEDSTVIVWDSKTGQLIRKLFGHKGYVSSAVWFRDGRRLATSGWDATARVWDIATARVMRILTGPTSGLTCITLSQDETMIAAGGVDQSVHIWSVADGKVARKIKGLLSTIWTVSFSPDGRKMLAGTEANGVRECDATSSDDFRVFTGHRDATSASFSPDGLYIVCGWQDGTSEILHENTGRTLMKLAGKKSEWHFAGFSPDGRMVGCNYTGGVVKIWSVTTGKEILTIPHLGKTRYGFFAFSPDSQRVAVPGTGNTIRILEVTTGRERLLLQGHVRPCGCVVYSPDGSKIASGGGDLTVRIWNAQTGRENLVLKGHTANISNTTFSRDSRLISSCGDDKTVRIWDAMTGRLLVTMSGLATAPYGSAFSPDGTRILTYCPDGTAKLWNTASGQELLTLHHPGDIYTAEFSPDGRRILTSCADGIIRVFTSDPLPRPDLKP